jgi:formamidopyrimidine-DNA glycosylase
MPELPEVETVCRGLRNKILKDTIQAVEVLRIESVGHPSWKEFARKLPGHVIENVRRRGKYILIDLDKKAGLVCHLRMSGRFLISPEGRTDNKFLRVRLVMSSGRELHFEDMRVFGRLWYVPPGVAFEKIVTGLANLGVEPLTDLTAQELSRLFKQRKQSVKSALLDQTLIAGVGNIYADESLFQAGIHPARAAGSLKPSELTKLAETIKRVLAHAIILGGSTLRDYTSSEGVNGSYQHQAWVYGRTGENCRTCRTKIERMKIGGRSSHFCSTCQKPAAQPKAVKKKEPPTARQILSLEQKKPTRTSKRTKPEASAKTAAEPAAKAAAKTATKTATKTANTAVNKAANKTRKTNQTKKTKTKTKLR